MALTRQFAVWFGGAPVLHLGTTGDLSTWFGGAPVVQLDAAAAASQINRDSQTPLDWVASIDRDGFVPIDFEGIGTRKDSVAPVEWLQTVARDGTIPYAVVGPPPGVRTRPIPVGFLESTTRVEASF